MGKNLIKKVIRNREIGLNIWFDTFLWCLMKWIVSASASLLEILRKRLTDIWRQSWQHNSSSYLCPITCFPVCLCLSFPRIFRSGLSSCCLSLSELRAGTLLLWAGICLSLACSPTGKFLLWIWTNLSGHSNTSWSFFRSLTEFYWTAAVNFGSNNGRVEFSNLVLPKVSLKPSVLLSSNLSMF